jgi:hypothetical protein
VREGQLSQCSRNARPEKALVGRAHLWITDPPLTAEVDEKKGMEVLLNVKGMREGVARCPSCRRTRTLRKCSFNARSKGQPWPFPQNSGIGDQKALRRTSFVRSLPDRL